MNGKLSSKVLGTERLKMGCCIRIIGGIPQKVIGYEYSGPKIVSFNQTEKIKN